MIASVFLIVPLAWHCPGFTQYSHPWMSWWQVLNLLLYALTQREPDQQLLEFLTVDETLVDIGDDLVDYEAWM